jgi:tetratricopeptide (TPR) repeat protein
MADVEAMMLRATRKIFEKSANTGTPESTQPNGFSGVALPAPPQNKWVRRGQVLMSRGDMIGAISEFSQALLANQRETEAYIGRGRAFQATGGYDLAMRDFNAAIVADPKNSRAYSSRGSLHHALSTQRVEDREMLLNAALDDLNQAVALDPNCAEAYKYRSMVYSTLDGNVLETSRGSRAVYDAYLSLTLNPNCAPAKG